MAEEKEEEDLTWRRERLYLAVGSLFLPYRRHQAVDQVMEAYVSQVRVAARRFPRLFALRGS